MAANLAKGITVQLVAWMLSAGMIIILCPFLLIFWAWSLVTDYSDTVKRKSKSGSKGWRISRGWGISRYVQLKDVSIHYVEAGDRSRPLMLCLHGFPECWFSWRFQLKEFASTHRVVAVDLRGYGDSDKPNGLDAYRLDRLVEDVRQIIDILGNGECDVLLAHDWGGKIGWELVAKHPHLVRRFVPMNFPHPQAFLTVLFSDYTQMIKSWYVFFFQLPVIPERILLAFQSSFMKRRFGIMKSPNSQVYLDLFKEPKDMTGPINYYRNLIDPKTMGRPPQVVKVPTLLIWGTNDRALNTSMAHHSVKWAENITLGLIPGASHQVQQDAPDIVNRKIREFLQSS